jgi:hypothetical protein
MSQVAVYLSLQPLEGTWAPQASLIISSQAAPCLFPAREALLAHNSELIDWSLLHSPIAEALWMFVISLTSVPQTCPRVLVAAPSTLAANRPPQVMPAQHSRNVLPGTFPRQAFPASQQAGRLIQHSTLLKDQGISGTQEEACAWTFAPVIFSDRIPPHLIICN